MLLKKLLLDMMERTIVTMMAVHRQNEVLFLFSKIRKFCSSISQLRLLLLHLVSSWSGTTLWHSCHHHRMVCLEILLVYGRRLMQESFKFISFWMLTINLHLHVTVTLLIFRQQHDLWMHQELGTWPICLCVLIDHGGLVNFLQRNWPVSAEQYFEMIRCNWSFPKSSC